MAKEEYIDVKFDIFEYVGQRARVRKSLNVRALKDEILREFDDIPAYDPDSYAIYIKGAEKPLDEKQTLAELDVQPQDELIFDHFRNLIRRMLPTENHAVFVDDRSGKAFSVEWQPAMIGRPGTEMDHNMILAVNLQTVPGGNWISRRHAQVTFSGGKYYIEPLAEFNQVSLNGKTLHFGKKVELKSGDKLLLGPKNLPLTFQTRGKLPKPESKTDPMSKAAAQVKVAEPPSAPSRNLDIPYATIVAASEEQNVGKVIRFEELPLVLGRMHPLLKGENQVSRQHIRIEKNPQSGQLLLVDLESTNGVTVNGAKIAPNTPVEIGNGSQIGLGNNLVMQLYT